MFLCQSRRRYSERNMRHYFAAEFNLDDRGNTANLNS
jgi:hypothetical protein